MNKKRGTLLRLCKYLMRYKWGLLLAVLLTVGSNLFALVGPEPVSYTHLTLPTKA